LPIAVTLATWHVFEIRLEQGNGGYLASWLVDGVVVENEQLAYGPAAATFTAFVSVENLSFIGETYPTGRNDAYFDWFRHRAQ
jgi:hypothetical protein